MSFLFYASRSKFACSDLKIHEHLSISFTSTAVESRTAVPWFEVF